MSQEVSSAKSRSGESLAVPNARKNRSSSLAVASQQSLINPIDEQFISQIVLTPAPLEQPLATVLKAIVPAGKANNFMETLGQWAKAKETEIEMICASGYGQFVPLVEGILGKIRGEAVGVGEKIKELGEDLRASGQVIYDTRVERFESRKMMLDIAKGINSLQDSLKALELSQKISLEIVDGNYHEALKLIDELQSKGALRAVEEMPFYKALQGSLTLQVSRVKEAAVSQVKGWLGKARDDSIIMGSLAMSQVQSRLEQFQRMTQEQQNDKVFDNLELFLLESAPEDTQIIIKNDLVRVDFGPLQDALRLFEMMDKEGEFKQLLMETRKVQAELLLAMPVQLEKPDSDPKSLRSFLNAASGFFIMEHLLSRLPQGFYPVSSVESLWEFAQIRFHSIALDSLRLSSSDRPAFMKIKWLQVFFVHCMDMFSFPVGSLIETILTLFYRYVDLLRKETVERVDDSILRDPLTPMPYSNTVAKSLPHLTLKLLAPGEQLALPFSQSLWDVFQCIQQFLSNFRVFLEGVPKSSNRLGDFEGFARKTVDEMILPQVARYYFKLFERTGSNGQDSGNSMKSSSSTIQVIKQIQILKNLYCLELMAVAPQGELFRIFYSPDLITKHQLNSSLSASGIFAATRKSAEIKLLETVNEQVDVILEKLQYERMASGVLGTASAPIQELVKFFGNLRGSLAASDDGGLDFIWTNLLAHVSAFLDNKILTEPNSPLNQNFFKNLQVDLTYLLDFTKTLKPTDPDTTDPQTNPYRDLFASPLQLCTLLTADSVHEYLNPVVRKAKYGALETERLVTVLGRVREPIQKRRSVEDLILLLK